MSDLAVQLATHDHRLVRHDREIRYLHRDVRWLRGAVYGILVQMGVE